MRTCEHSRFSIWFILLILTVSLAGCSASRPLFINKLSKSDYGEELFKDNSMDSLAYCYGRTVPEAQKELNEIFSRNVRYYKLFLPEKINKSDGGKYGVAIGIYTFDEYCKKKVDGFNRLSTSDDPECQEWFRSESDIVTLLNE